MKRLLLSLALGVLLPLAPVSAQAGGQDLLGRVLVIADPDQVKAYQELNLSPDQLRRLQSAALEFLPRLEQTSNLPGGHLMLVPEALRRVDGILTPAQRPLVRKMIPRSHQWAKLKSLYEDYRQQRT